MAAIGIDLGTTNCCIAVMKHGKPDIITDSCNKRTIPSYIHIMGDEILCGRIAKDRLFRYPQNTIYDVKRMIGLNYSDVNSQKMINQWKFAVLKHMDKLQILIKIKNENKYYTPEQLNSLLLKHLKKYAEERLDAKVIKAVITVPVHFSHAQRQATINAGKLAGFNEIKLINEPTAAAMAFAFDQNNGEKTCFIFDFGGGTFDVSIVKTKNKHVNVLAVDGDLHLGGGDIDNILFNHFDKEIKENINCDVKNSERIAQRLMEGCISIKEQLSSSVIGTTELISLYDDKDYELTLSRAKFDTIIQPILIRVKDAMQSCLNTAKLKVTDIDEVILVGGSSRIIKLQLLLNDFFGKEPKKNINADEAVALGAALYADSEEVTFTDIIPWSLGVQSNNGDMSIIIIKGSSLPYSNSKIFTTVKDGQSFIKLKIYCGENQKTINNNFLGELMVVDLPVAPKGTIKIEETFTVDSNVILKVVAIDLSTNRMYNLTLDLPDKPIETYNHKMDAKLKLIQNICDQIIVVCNELDMRFPLDLELKNEINKARVESKNATTSSLPAISKTLFELKQKR